MNPYHVCIANIITVALGIYIVVVNIIFLNYFVLSLAVIATLMNGWIMVYHNYVFKELLEKLKSKNK